MSKKNNTDFLTAFIELEGACNGLLGTKRGGVSEYINRLNEFKSNPDIKELSKKLITYRSIRNKLAHEEGALSDIRDIDRSDVRWLANFKKKIKKERDPLSLCIRREKLNSIGRILRISAIAAAAVAVLILIIMLCR